MTDASLRSMNLAGLVIGLCLMLTSACLYCFYNAGVFVAVSLFCVGSVLAGVSVLISGRGRGRGGVARIALGWSFVALSVPPIVLVVLFFSNWVGP